MKNTNHYYFSKITATYSQKQLNIIRLEATQLLSFLYHAPMILF